MDELDSSLLLVFSCATQRWSWVADVSIPLVMEETPLMLWTPPDLNSWNFSETRLSLQCLDCGWFPAELKSATWNFLSAEHHRGSGTRSNQWGCCSQHGGCCTVSPAELKVRHIVEQWSTLYSLYVLQPGCNFSSWCFVTLRESEFQLQHIQQKKASLTGMTGPTPFPQPFCLSASTSSSSSLARKTIRANVGQPSLQVDPTP